jgi:hypothetical protein
MCAIRTFLNHTDNYPKCDLPVDRVRDIIFGHFDISDRMDLLVKEQTTNCPLIICHIKNTRIFFYNEVQFCTIAIS